MPPAPPCSTSAQPKLWQVDAVLARFTQRYPTAEAAGQACAMQMADVLAPLHVDVARLARLLAPSPHDEGGGGGSAHTTPHATPQRAGGGSAHTTPHCTPQRAGGGSAHTTPHATPQRAGGGSAHTTPHCTPQQRAGGGSAHTTPHCTPQRAGGGSAHTTPHCTPQQRAGGGSAHTTPHATPLLGRAAVPAASPGSREVFRTPAGELATCVKTFSREFVARWGWWAPPAQLYSVRHSEFAADAHALFCEGLWQTPRMLAPGGLGGGGEVELGRAPEVLRWYHRWLLGSGLVGVSKRGLIVGQVG
jgi:hypothetical protein